MPLDTPPELPPDVEPLVLWAPGDDAEPDAKPIMVDNMLLAWLRPHQRYVPLYSVYERGIDRSIASRRSTQRRTDPPSATLAHWAQNATVTEYQQGSYMCTTIQLTGKSMFIIIVINDARCMHWSPWLFYHDSINIEAFLSI